MKNTKVCRQFFVFLLAGLISAMLLSVTAFAAGTLAGTVISNKATATYTDANNNTYTPVESNTVTVTVSQVAGVVTSPATSNQNGSPDGNTFFNGQIINTGNGTDTFNLSAAGLPSGYTYVIYKDTNGDGILQSSEAVLGNRLGATITLNADQAQYAIAVITSPVDAASGSTATLTFTATSTFSPGTSSSSTMTITNLAAVISFSKSTVPTNPKPGDTVTYTITWNNTGTAAGYLAVLSDGIPTNTTYKTGSMTYGGAVRTDISDGDNADYNVTNPGKVTVAIGTVAAGGTGTFTFQVTVNAGVPSSTLINNVASASYRTNEGDSLTTTTVNTNTSPFTVSQLAGIQVLPSTLTTSELVGNQNRHPFTIRNTGNGTDTFSISSVGLYWTWSVYNDVNQDGQYTPVVDTNADSIIDTGAIAQNDIKYFIAVVTVTGSNGQQGRHTITATSIHDATVTGTSIKYTNIQTPVVGLTKSVSPTGPQPPGAELTYTITVVNSGAATAQGFVITDVLSNYLDYKAGSITVAGAVQTDAEDGDFAHYNASGQTVTVAIPSISPGATLNIVFKVVIK
jgi:uncharacterized repeat protein (TIGR01451 family)/fimbrial isopeptide formation D2 family protein